MCFTILQINIQKYYEVGVNCQVSCHFNMWGQCKFIYMIQHVLVCAHVYKIWHIKVVHEYRMHMSMGCGI